MDFSTIMPETGIFSLILSRMYAPVRFMRMSFSVSQMATGMSGSTGMKWLRPLICLAERKNTASRIVTSAGRDARKKSSSRREGSIMRALEKLSDD